MDHTIDSAIASAGDALRAAQLVVVFTGAGVSAESGIPTFRSGDDALWANADLEQFANPRGYRRRSSDAWRWYARRAEVARDAMPNAAHFAIAQLERRVPAFLLVTQNIDGLHHRAGSEKILELHGTLRRVRCFDCSRYADWPAPLGEPSCAHCGGLLRPDVVMFEEELPPGAMERAVDAARQCDVLVSVGTSNLVWPAAEIPRAALRAGRTVIVVNPDIDGQPRGPSVIQVQSTAASALPVIVARSEIDP
jgi:NAD-dependent protein deacetylase/lipoamidase